MTTVPPRKFRILLIGDDCRDIYHFGTVNRLSPEAPVPIFEPQRSVEYPGMAGNVYENLRTLGCQVIYLSTGTCVKERMIDQRSKAHLLRIDRDVNCDAIELGPEVNLSDLDAVVISDYNKGTVTADAILWIRSNYNGPVFVDTKKTDLEQFSGCWIKINHAEHSAATTLPDPEWLIVTVGDQGAVWNWQKFPAKPAGDVIDVCGAGDTFLAALTYQYLMTGDMPKSIDFANRAAAVTVQHVGVYAPTLEEIQ